MLLNYAKIKSGQTKPPMLRLRTLAGKELGVIPFVYDLKFKINYAEVSTIEFSVPYQTNGMINPLYSALSSYKVIYTDDLGIYLLTSPTKKGDGMSEVKTVKGYSLEQMFTTKTLFLESGTFNFWNPIDKENTILGRITELDPSWTVGYVSPRLIGCYRTFDGYDNDALSFCYKDAMEKYLCAVVFDVYNRTINAYDTNIDAQSIPVYLNYKNLVSTIEVKEITDNIATKLHLYGSNDLSINGVNPTGADYIVNLDYFLSNGDLDITIGGKKLSDRVRNWQASVSAKQELYKGIVSARASMTAQKLAATADLTDLNGELNTLKNQQSITVKALANEKTDDGRANRKSQLSEINKKITAKKSEIAEKEKLIKTYQSKIDEYTKSVSAIVKQLSYETFFTKDERAVLNGFLIEGNVKDETFVSTDVETNVSGAVAKISGEILIQDKKSTNSDGSKETIQQCEITRVDLTDFQKQMFMITGGTISVQTAGISADIVRASLDKDGDNSYVLSAYLGKTTYGDQSFDSGMITISGSISHFSTDVAAKTVNGVTQYKGTNLKFQAEDANSYFTVNTNSYQEYSVEMELYDFGAGVLDDYAWPTYEFTIDSANFLYHEKFEPFKNKLELGKSVHLELGSEGHLSAKIIGVELDFSDISKFKLMFSNKYQRKNAVMKWINEIKGTSSSSRNFDTSKYIYKRSADKMTDVTAYMGGMLDAAKQAIIGGTQQSVVVDGSGVHITTTDTTNGNDKIELRMVNGMIAMSNDNWETAKLAIGRFYSKDHNMDVWGVNAELIAGTLLIGSNLFIQTENGFFSVDNDGVRIDAMKFYITHGTNPATTLASDLNGLTSSIEDVNNTLNGVSNDLKSVTTKNSSGIYLNASDLSGMINAQRSQMQSGTGNVLFDSDGIWLMNATAKNLATKAVWMNENGILFGSGSETSDPGSASSGWSWTTAIGHDGITADALYGKTLNAVQINGGRITIGRSSSSDNDYLYVDSGGNLFIGKRSDDKGYNFAVTSDGRMFAQAGTFAGELVAASGTFSGSLSAVDGTFTGTLRAANIKGTLTADSSVGGEIVGCAIYVPNKTDPKFKVDSSGNVTMSGNIYMGDGTIKFSDLPSSIKNTINDSRQASADIANGKYSGGTFISRKKIYSPTIYADEFVVRPQTTASSGSWNGGYKMLGYYGSSLYEMLQINYEISADTPTVKFGSPCSAYANWDFSRTYFNGYLNFSNATIEGLNLKARFG